MIIHRAFWRRIEPNARRAYTACGIEVSTIKNPDEVISCFHWKLVTCEACRSHYGETNGGFYNRKSIDSTKEETRAEV